MKKIMLIVMVLLLVGCGGPEVFEYESMATELIYQTDVVERTVISDEELIKDIYNVLTDTKLNDTKDVVMMVQVELVGVPTLYLDGSIIEFSGETYELSPLAVRSIETLIKEYLDRQITEDLVEDKDESLPDLSDYTYLETLNNGIKIYYKEMVSYFKRDRASEILALEDNMLVSVYTGELSIPVVNNIKSNIAFVSEVGFEMNGSLHIYDGALKKITSDELEEKMLNSRTLKDATWYDEDTLFVILGFNVGTVSQGGDVYFIDTSDGDMRMVLDAKAEKEIVNIKYKDDILSFEVVTWTDKTYQNYEYSDESIVVSESLGLLPIKIQIDPVTEQ